jgi:hypothetical protein
MAFRGRLGTVPDKSPSSSFYNKSNFSLPKFCFFQISNFNSESALNSASNHARFIKIREKKISMILRSPTGAQWTVKNESRFSTAKITSFYSEFNTDSEYVILFKKFFGQKNGLTATCPL